MSEAPPKIAGLAPVARRKPKRVWVRVVKWVACACACVLLVVVLGLVFKDALIKTFAEHKIKAKTGMVAKIDSLEVGLTSGRVWLKNLRIYNTVEFGGSTFLEVPEIYVEVDPM
ncbi:MAG TPA: hypothetical protein VGE41_05365, partial [Verrucomicrobiae bacterium]